ncbi:ferrochelatase [Corynebacterium suranareeae]|uniref:Coproporphyrin III ferrochelatase n=1 Tax=Corynebacterium suranareeae TaxID=2506452 RepID=A0A160PTQ1_9CORY|nr:ferrochelatase [Corynebacterium suranareeae]BAU95890.1 ferrochelatase [Corynebacterium suranareeae]
MNERSSDAFDALLVLSFGGPEGHEEVRPFLENVTRGRGIPPERLDDVAVHYHHFGGVSPINGLNREIIANVEKELASRDLKLPVYFGNRNWKPFDNEAAELMADDGVKNALVLATSAWGGYSGCQQYQEDIQGMIKHLEAQGQSITFTKLRQFYDHPRFVSTMARLVQESYAKLPDDLRDEARLVFTAHSIPLSADNAAGTPEDGALYSKQVKEASALIAEAAGVKDFDVVWQSRSGSPHVPWLEPDIVDHAVELHEEGQKALVVCPVGFISDHMEVIWDLDSELMEEADKRGMVVERVATVGPTDEFAALVVDLVEEAELKRTIERLGKLPARGSSVNGAPCGEGCCGTAKHTTTRVNPNARSATPATS